MSQKGKVTTWNDDKGFGFITPSGAGKDIFVHIKAFKNKGVRPEVNQVVVYENSTDSRGRTCAKNVSRPGDTALKKNNRKSKHLLSIITFSVFFLILIVSILLAKLPSVLLAFYFIMSVVTFIVYAVDKSAAQNARWRTPENTLHLLSLFGGWPGALIAQQKLRHKSKKQPFRMIFWFTVMLNFVALIWFITPEGNSILLAIMASVS